MARKDSLQGGSVGFVARSHEATLVNTPKHPVGKCLEVMTAVGRQVHRDGVERTVMIGTVLCTIRKEGDTTKCHVTAGKAHVIVNEHGHHIHGVSEVSLRKEVERLQGPQPNAGSSPGQKPPYRNRSDRHRGVPTISA